MKIVRLLSFLLCALLTVSCSTYNIQAIEEPEGPVATVVVYQPHYLTGGGAPVVIAIDGVDIALLKNNNYLEIPVRPGPHTLSVRGFRVGRTDEKEMVFKEGTMVVLKVEKPLSVPIPLAMHLTKLYLLEEEKSLTAEEIRSKFARVKVGVNSSK